MRTISLDTGLKTLTRVLGINLEVLLQWLLEIVRKKKERQNYFGGVWKEKKSNGSEMLCYHRGSQIP
jgi:hypothetical protein